METCPRSAPIRGRAPEQWHKIRTRRLQHGERLELRVVEEHLRVGHVSEVGELSTEGTAEGQPSARRRRGRMQASTTHLGPVPRERLQADLGHAEVGPGLARRRRAGDGSRCGRCGRLLARGGRDRRRRRHLLDRPDARGRRPGLPRRRRQRSRAGNLDLGHVEVAAKVEHVLPGLVDAVGPTVVVVVVGKDGVGVGEVAPALRCLGLGLGRRRRRLGRRCGLALAGRVLSECELQRRVRGRRWVSGRLGGGRRQVRKRTVTVLPRCRNSCALRPGWKRTAMPGQRARTSRKAKRTSPTFR